ncbi:hypothetical protein [Virgibacillus ihumii]|uniref:hypothetical protein n=1 Tax=Virgibacillus ihumii TaxID=2686091 RepID=UPI00157D193B|nr:hypothetical protein [Virgibacillus ihumii]
MKKGLSAGFTVGILSGVTALITEFIIGSITGLWFKELNIVSIMFSCIITNLAGSVIFVNLDKKTSKPTLYYTMIVAGVTLFLTFNTIVNPPQEQFGTVSHPLHIVAALLSIWLIPTWTVKNVPFLQDNLTQKSN